MIEGRNKILLRASWVATVGNTLLSASKIAVGLFAGSLAVLGDGIDSATDVVISIVMLCTSRIVNRPPTRRFAYGFEKAEGIATKLVSFVIFVAGLQMLIASVRGILSPDPRELPSIIAIWVTVFSVLGKLALAIYQYREGKRADSQMLIANAKNMRNDVIISLGVLVGLFFTFILRMPILDTVTGLVISLYIMRSAIGIFMDSSIELMDGVKDTKVYNLIFEAVDSVPGASNPHRVRSRRIGNLYMIALDVEADGSITLDRAHDIAEQVEHAIRGKVRDVYDIIVHVEPAGKCHAEEKFGVDKRMLE